MLQIIFNEISAAEISSLSTIDQLELLNQFKVSHEDLEQAGDENTFGTIDRDGGKLKLYRYKSKDYRIYFEVTDKNVVVHRVLHKNTLKDFLYRSNLPLSEDKALSESKNFWKLIEEGEKAQKI
ncbi:MAG: type II toxin-antitoxin system RelE/ParE family toxin [Verrucomicrobiota bacterium]|nr:type II toxin-antitoxin system RelE/ParE family toxin [Verrucomicrobiota bacterium]